MASTALAFKDEHQEVPVSSTEVLQANVASIRADLNELKIDFRGAVERIDHDIKSAVTTLRSEIREMAAKAEKDLERFADHVETQFAMVRTDISGLRSEISELRSEQNSLRERMDRGFERLSTRFDAEIKETHKIIGELSKVVLKMDSRLSAIAWVGGGLVALATLAVSLGKAFQWF